MDYGGLINYTVKQHYIPQVYLRGFSPDYEKAKNGIIDASQCRIFFYDIEKQFQSTAIPISTVCYEKNLYEVTDKDGEIIARNHIEKVLSRFEAKFSEYRDMIEKKAFLSENYKSNMFLKYEERVFWATYITIQLLRMPRVIKLAEQTCKEVYGDIVTANQARNISREWCTPFFRELSADSPETKLFATFFEPMENMAFGVFADVEGRIVTSDKTVYMHTTKFPCCEYEKIIFPISSKLCLILFGGEEKRELPKKNFLCPMDEEVRKMVFSAVADASFRKIYANHRLDSKELKMIKMIMQGDTGYEVHS